MGHGDPVNYWRDYIGSTCFIYYVPLKHGQVMQMAKGLLRVVLISMAIVGGILIGGTVVAVKGVDRLGDKLQDKLH